MSEQHLDACRILGPAPCGRVLLVGENNPLSADPRHALYHQPPNCAGHRLQSRILAVRARQTYLPMWRTNLCLGAWDPDMASSRALTLCGDGDRPWRTIVLLGVRVARAFSEALRVRVDLFEGPIRSRGEILLVPLPHPSGRNLAWNDEAKMRLARAILRRAEPDVPWGELASDTSGR